MENNRVVSSFKIRAGLVAAIVFFALMDLLSGFSIGLMSFVAVASARPNVLFLMADDLGWTDVAFMGSTYHNTPNLDELAKDGMVFTNSYAVSPYCVPSRAGIMTGQWPARCFWGETALTAASSWAKNIQGRPKHDAAHTYPLHEERTHTAGAATTPIVSYSLAQMFSDNGYNTGHFGKWHLGNLEHAPEALGFDVNLGGGTWGEPYSYYYPFSNKLNSIAGQNLNYGPDLNVSVKKYAEGVPISGNHSGGTLNTTEYLGLELNEGDFLTDVLTDGAISFIDKSLDADEPFFANVWFHNSHLPFTPKPEIYAKYVNKTDPRGHHLNPAYAALIETLDTNIGRLVDHLKEKGEYDNTIIVFTSDNGGKVDESEFVTSNAPLRGGKGTLYEGGFKVPTAIKWVGDFKKGVSADRIAGVDYYFTFKNMLNAAVPDGYVLDGIDFSGVVAEGKKLPSRPIILYDGQLQNTQELAAEPGAVIIKDGFKLLYDFNDGIKVFDLENDISERYNVAGSHTKITADLYSALMAKLTEMGSYIPKVNPAYNPDHMQPGLLEYYNSDTVKPLKEWSFDTNITGWQPAGHRMATLSHNSANGYLVVTEKRQADPALTVFPAFAGTLDTVIPAGFNIMVWRYRRYQPGQTSISTGSGDTFPAASSLIFSSVRGEWAEDVLLFYNNETAANAIMLGCSNRNYYGYNDALLGFTAPNDKGYIEIDYIKIYTVTSIKEFSKYAIRKAF